METLNQQLQNINSRCLEIIKDKVVKFDGRYLIATFSEAFNEDTEELEQDFYEDVPELVHYFEGEGNETIYPMLLVGDKNRCDLQTINEQGEVKTIDVFELDVHNLTNLADYLNRA